ncbi:hypothetical protein HMI55_006517 [Coelomomyces lativittatus]|nr:hypothetical protein HMI55_006517 [Coelomomyces lativittatus]
MLFFKSVAHQKQLLNQSFHSLLPSTHSVSSKQEKGPSTHLNTETFSDDLFNEDEEEEIEENKKEKGRELNGLSFKSSTSYAYSNEMDLDFDMPEEVSMYSPPLHLKDKSKRVPKYSRKKVDNGKK